MTNLADKRVVSFSRPKVLLTFFLQCFNKIPSQSNQSKILIANFLTIFRQIIIQIITQTIRMISERVSFNRNFDKQLTWKSFLQKLNLPDIMPDYASKAYWQARYEMQEYQTVDWYVEFADIQKYLFQFLSPSMQILEIGSGNSKLLDKLWDRGYRKLTGSDFSWQLINQRKEQEKMLQRGLKWEILDVTKQWPKRKNLNCIIEKAVLDCLSPAQMDRALQIIYDALPPGGLFVHISNAKAEKRIKLSEVWDVRIYELHKVNIPLFKEVDKSQVYYMYRCYK